MALPNDPIMLLSVVNLKLRDFYKNLDALCEDLDADKADLCAKLRAAPARMQVCSTVFSRPTGK